MDATEPATAELPLQKRVLIIAYFFSPGSNMGSQSSAAIRASPARARLEPVVLTGPLEGWRKPTRIAANACRPTSRCIGGGMDLTALRHKLRRRRLRRVEARVRDDVFESLGDDP